MRSAFVSATVVLVALMAGRSGCPGAVPTLLDGVDAAATRRVHDVVAGLQSDSAADLDASQLATDQQIVAVQIVDASGAIFAPRPAPKNSNGSAEKRRLRAQRTTQIPLDAEMRVSGQTVDAAGGRYTV